MKPPPKNVPASVRQRLLNRAKETGRLFNEIAQYYALERWLYRLSRSEHRDRFVLKGALMLLVWELPVTRPTRDIDLLGRVSNDLEDIRRIIAAVCQVPVEDDGMLFEHTSVQTSRIAEDADYEGVRALFEAKLGNMEMPMQIDIGFSDIVTPGAVRFVYPAILGQAAPELDGYNQQTAIAEKFQAMVKLGELNSRMKDFFDVWMLARTKNFQGRELADAITQTFQRRGTPLTANPICFSETFAANPAKIAQWRAFVRRGRFAEPAPAFVDVVKSVSDFLGPPTLALMAGEPWDKHWSAGGPWMP